MGFQKGLNPQQNVHRQVAEEDPFLDLDVLQVDEETQDFCTQLKTCQCVPTWMTIPGTK